jgi:LCP family protein required for cell wall assembly
MKKNMLLITCIFIIFCFVIIGVVILLNAYDDMHKEEITIIKEETFEKDKITYIKRNIEMSVSKNYLFLVPDVKSNSTDTILIVNHNYQEDKLSLLSIPRDTYIESDYSNKRVNAIYAKENGIEILIEKLNEKFGLDIEFYFIMRINAIKEIVDSVDGVEFNIPAELHYDDPTQDLYIHFKKGLQLLDGDDAVKFLRFRQPNYNRYNDELKKYYNGSDISRIKMQQEFIKEFINQKAKPKYISKVDDVIRALFKNIKTNITFNEALKVSNKIDEKLLSTFQSYILKGDSKKIDGRYYYIIDMTDANNIIKNNFSTKKTVEIIEEHKK